MESNKLSVENWWPMDARPFLAPDVGPAFDIVPDEPGVLVLTTSEYITLGVQECDVSMRRRIVDIYKGEYGGMLSGAAFVGFEACENPAAKRAELLAEHLKRFGSLPAANKR